MQIYSNRESDLLASSKPLSSSGSAGRWIAGTNLRASGSQNHAGPNVGGSKGCFLALALCCMCAGLSLPHNAMGGTGRVRTVGGVHFLDFCVSIRFTATAGEVANIQAVFTAANVIVADATDGQYRFGDISIVNNSGAGQQADVWINSGTGRAYATIGLYGTLGSHITTFFDSNFMSNPNANGDAYTIAHEFMHHLWGVVDEYSGPDNCLAPTMNINADCEVTPGSLTANFCLLDNYFLRGGNNGSALTDNYTLNELCVAANHDPDADTWEECIWGQSCWERLATHPTRPAFPPAVLPIDPAPAVVAPTFRLPGADRRFVLCVDRSGSMTIVEPCAMPSSRMDLAQDAGDLVVDLTDVGDEFALTSFSTTASKDFPGGAGLQLISGNADRVAAKAAIAGLAPTDWTSIAGGLVVSRDTLLAAPVDSCVQTIFLVTDGCGNRDAAGNPAVNAETDPALLASLGDNDINVITISIGTPCGGAANLMQIATDTGGAYFALPCAADLPALQVALAAEESGGGVLAMAPGVFSPEVAGDVDHDGDVDFDDLLIVVNGFGAGFDFDDLLLVQNNFGATNAQQVLEVLVDEATQDAAFALPWPNRNDNLDMSLRSPSGQVITRSDAGVNPDVRFVDGGTYELFRVRRPTLETGTWRVVITASTLTDGTFSFVATSDVDAYSLSVAASKPLFVAPEPIKFIATPQCLGLKVVGATVNGRVVRPDGSSVPITLLDNGNPANGDDMPNDGDYSALFSDFAGSGGYALEVTSANENGMTYGGEALFASVGVPPMIEPVPRFRRAGAGSAILLVPSGRDCNGNGMDDAEDILYGRSFDANHDGIPDECCPRLDFEAFTTGTSYQNGTIILTNQGGIQFLSVDPFYFGPVCGTNVTTSGLALVTENGMACRSGKEMAINNVNLSFFFDGTVSGLSFYYGYGGGTLNIEINGECLVFSDFASLDGLTLGGVVIHNERTSESCGRLSLNGPIAAFKIGGQEFAIDDLTLCPDCNGNGINDSTDIAAENSKDINGNGIPDECEQ